MPWGTQPHQRDQPHHGAPSTPWRLINAMEHLPNHGDPSMPLGTQPRGDPSMPWGTLHTMRTLCGGPSTPGGCLHATMCDRDVDATPWRRDPPQTHACFSRGSEVSTCRGLGGQPGLAPAGGRGGRGSCRDRLGERSGLSNCTAGGKGGGCHPTVGSQHPCLLLGGHLSVPAHKGTSQMSPPRLCLAMVSHCTPRVGLMGAGECWVWGRVGDRSSTHGS